MSEYLTALILGLVEGLTEFVPVSSTGHLILVADLLKFSGEKEKAFEVFIQLGAILAVVVLYYKRFVALFLALFPLGQWFKKETYAVIFTPEKNSSALNQRTAGIIALVLVTLPALVIGGILHTKVKALFYPVYVGWALIIGGIIFILIEKKKFPIKIRTLDDITPKVAFLIGCFQTLALWPGVSRSGATLIGAMLLGVERSVAADFSFLAAVPLITAAASVDFLKVYSILTSQDLVLFGIGFVVSFFAGMASIKILIGVLKRFSLRPFGYYRLLLGGLILIVAYSS